MADINVHAEPGDFAFDPETAGLLVIDMQNDFCRPGGYLSFRVPDITLLQRPIEPLQQVLKACRNAGMTILHTREGHRPDLSDCPPSKLAKNHSLEHGIGQEGPLGRFLIRGSRSHDFIDELQPEPGEVVIDKPGKGAFFATELDLILRTRGVTHLIVGGVATHVCVQSSLREAADRGYWSLVLEDCCASSVPELHHATFEMVKYGGGIFGQVSDSDALLNALAAA
jgi:nicotinamidase-related amidase